MSCNFVLSQISKLLKFLKHCLSLKSFLFPPIFFFHSFPFKPNFHYAAMNRKLFPLCKTSPFLNCDLGTFFDVNYPSLLFSDGFSAFKDASAGIKAEALYFERNQLFY